MAPPSAHPALQPHAQNPPSVRSLQPIHGVCNAHCARFDAPHWCEGGAPSPSHAARDARRHELFSRRQVTTPPPPPPLPRPAPRSDAHAAQCSAERLASMCRNLQASSPMIWSALWSPPWCWSVPWSTPWSAPWLVSILAAGRPWRLLQTPCVLAPARLAFEAVPVGSAPPALHLWNLALCARAALRSIAPDLVYLCVCSVRFWTHRSLGCGVFARCFCSVLLLCACACVRPR
jgi:hypothetical protein